MARFAALLLANRLGSLLVNRISVQLVPLDGSVLVRRPD
jgi:hypothetical protein